LDSSQLCPPAFSLSHFDWSELPAEAIQSARIRRLFSRRSAFVSSDPKTLTPEVCPVTGTPAFQPLSWINENNLLFII
jgi:hypothetical protein